MKPAFQSGPSGPPSSEWIEWPEDFQCDPCQGARWLYSFRLKVFRIVLGLSSAVMLYFIIRDIAMGEVPGLIDTGIAVVLVLNLMLTRLRPDLIQLQGWFVLAALLTSVLDGLWLPDNEPVSPTMMLLPLLPLFGALLVNLWMSAAGLAMALGIYTWTWAVFSPMSRVESLKLTNLALTSVIAATAALAILIQHWKHMRELRGQADDLRQELESRMRLEAVVFHDIRNPLGALMCRVSMMKTTGDISNYDLESIEEMAGRILTIITSAKGIEEGTSQKIVFGPVSVMTLYKDLCTILAHRLDAKEQTLVLTEGEELEVLTGRHLLTNSVLSNLLTNAIKFSPKGAALEMAAISEQDCTRIEIRDRGPGITEMLIQDISQGKVCRCQAGSEGEKGSGYGLRIASLYLRKLNGQLLFRNMPGGGAVAGIRLRSAHSRRKVEDPTELVAVD